MIDETISVQDKKLKKARLKIDGILDEILLNDVSVLIEDYDEETDDIPNEDNRK